MSGKERKGTRMCVGDGDIIYKSADEKWIEK